MLRAVFWAHRSARTVKDEDVRWGRRRSHRCTEGNGGCSKGDPGSTTMWKRERATRLKGRCRRVWSVIFRVNARQALAQKTSHQYGLFLTLISFHF